MRKPLLLLIIILLISVLWLFAGDLFSLRSMQAALGALRESFQAHPFLFVLGFMAIYILVTASSLPFATVLTLLGGAIFGFWWGIGIISISATIGCTLAFWGARYFFRGSVQKRYGQRLSHFNEGIKRDGAFYLFSLRLIPIFPFFLVNILMALTPIRTQSYIWVSWLGMLPGTAIYVFAGRNFGQIESLSGLMSWPIFISLTLLGLFPWLAKFLLARFQGHKIYKNFSKPKSFDRNLIVIGAGSAGLVSAYMGAQMRAKTTLIEAHEMGGDCLNTGCIPSKTLIKSANIAAKMQNAAPYGIKSQSAEIDLPTLSNRIQSVIKSIAPNDSVERYSKMGVDVVKGRGRLIDPWRVEITPNDGKPYQLTTKSIVIATGAAPLIPPLKGLEKIEYLTSETLWSNLSSWPKLPQSLLILGGGNIGCELAQSLNRLGVSVTIVEMSARLLPNEDEEVSEFIAHKLHSEGVTILTQTEAKEFQPQICQAEQKGESIKIPFEKLLIAVGRKPRLENLGLEELGIQTDRAILSNRHLQTNIPNIYVAGDATPPYQFTHTAAYEGTYAALNALFPPIYKFKMDHRFIPMVTFTDPEIARAGLNESEARAQNINYEITKYPLSHLDRALTEGETEGWIKILTPKGKDKILGVTIIAPHAGEMLPEFTLAMKHKIGLRKILGTIHAYPTWGEAAKKSASIWSSAHLNPKLTAISERYFKMSRK